MSDDPVRGESTEQEAEHGRNDRPAETTKQFVKPTLTRHDSLPRVTTVVAGGGST